MAAGRAIVASDLPAFEAVLSGGMYGRLFPVENSQELARSVIALLSHRAECEALQIAALAGAKKFDWSEVGPQIMNVYLHAIGDGESVKLANESRGLGRLLRGENNE